MPQLMAGCFLVNISKKDFLNKRASPEFSTLCPFIAIFFCSKILRIILYYNFFYQRIITLPQVNPLPKDDKTTNSPSVTFHCSQASVKALVTDAAVVFPYFIMLLYT